MPGTVWAVKFAAAVAANRDTPVDVLVRLAGGEDVAARAGAASNPNVPDYLLARLAVDAEVRVQVAAAGSRHASEALLNVLAAHPHPDVRTAVATNPGVRADLLAVLVEDAGDADVRRAAAAHPNLSTAARVRLLNSSDWATRVGVGANRGFSGGELAGLAQRVDWALRAGVAANANTPADVLARLVECDDWDVQRAALANPGLPVAVLLRRAASGERRVQEAVCTNPSVPVQVLADLSRADVGVCGADAGQPLTTSGGRSGRWVRVAAARNPKLPDAALVQLAGESDWVVREIVERGAAARLAVPLRQRQSGTAVFAQAWLARSGVCSDADLRVAAVAAVPDAGVRAGHVLAFGPGWAAALAGFRGRYGDTYLPDLSLPAQPVRTRRRAPRNAAPAQLAV